LKSFDELRHDPNIDETKTEMPDSGRHLTDWRDKKCINEALAIWGRIDVLVNNAGRITYGASEELGCVFKIIPERQ
jgi:NADP-dependent 3-hydroxy acid dehydrogenase YdfG